MITHRRLDALLGLAERSIALLDRLRPLNAAAETERLIRSLAAGELRKPAWVYARPPDFSGLCAELSRVAERLATGDELAQLYAERARELELEARLAEQVGRPEFRALARLRYPAPPPLALAEPPAPPELSSAASELTLSHDCHAPDSLLRQMTSQITRLGLPVGVVLREDLPSVAAAAEDTVWIRPGVWLSRREAERIVVHELLGHVLPRLGARSVSLGLLRVGSARGADDEEGRALLLERRHGLYGCVRQAELYDRHLAALSVTEGAEWVETARLLVERGSDSERAVRTASRVHRGGGLARELVYLPALARVERALEVEPELEAWLGSGRLSVEAARILNRLYPELLGAQAGRVPGSIPEFHE